MRHYHVNVQMEGGYLPDDGWGYYPDPETAADSAAEHATMLADQDTESGDASYVSYYGGLWVINRWDASPYHLRTYVTVDECRDADCAAHAARDAGLPVLDFLVDAGFLVDDIADLDFLPVAVNRVPQGWEYAG